MLPVEVLDECQSHWCDAGFLQEDLVARSLEEWFWKWAEPRRAKYAGGARGILLIHANGLFTSSAARRQSSEGVELLKHIRLTTWLGEMRKWHAIVYSFEPMEHILRRRPGNLILTSPGVTFLRLPEALDLESAIRSRRPEFKDTNLTEILNSLATDYRAAPEEAAFRPFVACDYVPPDSEHELSNWWGIYKIYRGFYEMQVAGAGEVTFPEYEAPEWLPPAVAEFATCLESKKARYLDGGLFDAPPARSTEAGVVRALVGLEESARSKRVVYVDDEADNGWEVLLRRALTFRRSDAAPGGQVEFIVPPGDQALLNLRGDARGVPDNRKIQNLAQWIVAASPDLLVLDLRLLGRDEAAGNPKSASGMLVARQIRKMAPYLPVLLFTASNKAQTILVSRSLEIDDYWMKPGLGEHRSTLDAGQELEALADKIRVLLDGKYSWLGRVGEKVDEIAGKKDSHWWWEKPFTWPSPRQVGEIGPNPIGQDSHLPQADCRRHVLNELRAILYTFRVLLRLRGEFGTVPVLLEATLKSGICNRIGQVVERVHGLDRKDVFWKQLEFKSTGGNGRIGGFRRKTGVFVFRRRDWWAFRLFALRNRAVHHNPKVQISDQEIMLAVSDLVAWLAAAQRSAVKSVDHEGNPAGLMMHPEDSTGRGTRMDVCLAPQDPREDAVFRELLIRRPQYQSLTGVSAKILFGPQ